MNRHFAAIQCAFMGMTCLVGQTTTWGDRVTFRGERGEQTVEGNVLGETAEGGLLVQSADGRHWEIEPEELIKREKQEAPVELHDREALAESLEREYSSGFNVLHTKNYLIVYSTSEKFAEEAGRLFERIKSVFENYIRRQAGFDPRPLKQPLIAVIHASRDEYVQAMTQEIGPYARNTAGVYFPGTNRMYMYDMFGGLDEKWVKYASAVTKRTPDDLALLLATDNISTVIHEGVHQVAFNTGFHERGVRSPAWLTEGLATLLEVPEMDSKKRWAGVGQINWDRANELREEWHNLPVNSLEQLVRDDVVLRDPTLFHLGYSEAWALSYFLTKSRRKEYMDYVSRVNRRPIMEEYSPEDRLKDFRESFGETPEQMEGDFRRYVEKTIFKKAAGRARSR